MIVGATLCVQNGYTVAFVFTRILDRGKPNPYDFV